MKLHRYVDHQRLHIVTKDVISLSISVLLLFRHYISHKITFGAPSSGGVLRSACGAFIASLFVRFFRPSVCPSIELGTLWAQLLLQFYTDSFETSLVFDLGLKICMWFGYNPRIIFVTFFAS